MYHTTHNTLHIRDIQQIFIEDQQLFDKTIAALEQRNSLDKPKTFDKLVPRINTANVTRGSNSTKVAYLLRR